MSIIDTLITDRPGPGRYDWTDFNRVQEAVSYLVAEFSKRGYSVPTGQLPEWTRSGIAFASQCATYLDNVRALRAALTMQATTPACPPDMNGWTWGEANDLEKILVDLEDAILRLDLSAMVPCGPATCGGDYL